MYSPGGKGLVNHLYVASREQSRTVPILSIAPSTERVFKFTLNKREHKYLFVVNKKRLELNSPIIDEEWFYVSSCWKVVDFNVDIEIMLSVFLYLQHWFWIFNY